MENSDKVQSERLKLKKPFRLHLTNPNDSGTTFIWHINNFGMCPDQYGKALKSPQFGIFNWQNPRFHMLLYAGGVNEKSSKYLSVYLVKTSNDDENHTFNIKLGIISNKDKKTCFETCKKLERGNGTGLAEFFEREELQSSEEECFQPNGNLTIFCEIEIVQGSNYRRLQFLDLRLKELSDMYNIIYEKEKYCDLFLHVEEKTFRVHKAIVEARFPDLLKDIDGNKCKIKCIGSTTMNALLRYAYTGILNMNEINLFEIHSSGYELPSHLTRLLLEKQNKIETTTYLEKKVISFSWNIQSFSSIDPTKSIHYPLIGDYDLKWTWVDLYLSRTTDESDEDYITISIQRFTKECKRIICTIKTRDVTKTFIHTYNKEDKWTLPNFFSKGMLMSETVEGTSDEINLNFEIAISDGSKRNEIEKKELVLPSDSARETATDLISFRKDIRKILSAPKFCDVTLISGKNKFPAHKVILSASSSVFCEKFEAESAKKKNFEVMMDDLDTSVIKDMLAYIYCNEVELSLPGTKHINDMYSVAGKYKLSGLKTELLDSLKSNVSTETAADVLISAHEWDDEELKEFIYSYVCTNPLEIANSKEWEQVMLKRSDLATEVLKKTLSYFAAKNRYSNIETDRVRYRI